MSSPLGFRGKLVLVAVGTAAFALAVAGALVASAVRRHTEERIARTLRSQAELAAELLAHAQKLLAVQGLDAEADRVGAIVTARVTFIAADGRVLGDSAEPLDALASLENHASRPEIIEAIRTGVGEARRYSATSRTDMIYVAVPTAHPTVAFVRLAVPLTDLDAQIRAVAAALLTALAAALIGAAVAGALLTRGIGRRVRAIADTAARYRAGDLTAAGRDFGNDELGAVARTLDESVQELGRRLEEAARDRSQMEAILSGMIEGVLVVDAAGRVQLANQAARSMLGLDEVLLGRRYVEAVRHPAISDLVSTALKGQPSTSVELTPPRDEARTLMARAAPVTPGRAHGAVLVLHDVTELKRADRMRRDFIANVSHELRTPLTAIRGYVEALIDPELSSDDQQRFLAIIARHARRMEDLVTDLLRLARLDARQEPVELAACSTPAVLRAVVDDLAVVTAGRGQRVDITVDRGAETVQADAQKLHDVLRNLIANASAYGPATSRISVAAVPASAGQVAISIEDEGPGIPEAELGRIFERFYRVEKSRTRDPGGTGLGLSIVKHLVELQGGTVRAENRPSGGARFTIALPVPSPVTGDR